MNRMGSHLKGFIGSKQLRVDNFSQIFADESQSSAEVKEICETLRPTQRVSARKNLRINLRMKNNHLIVNISSYFRYTLLV
jgi:hypothetical protein